MPVWGNNNRAGRILSKMNRDNDSRGKMELIRGLHNLRPEHQGCVATIGNFDGVHLGHQTVLRQVKTKAQELNLPSVVVVFEPQPREFFAGSQAPARLTRFRIKQNVWLNRALTGLSACLLTGVWPVYLHRRLSNKS